MVLEGIFVDIFNLFFGDYIQNLDKKQVSLGIWEGNLRLENVQFKDDLLEDLGVPFFQLRLGFVGKFSLTIPWKNLLTQPVLLVLEDVLLLVNTADDATYDEETIAQKAWEQKQRQLRHIELVGSGDEDAAQPDKAVAQSKAKTTLKERLTARFISSLQVELRNVHLRYEAQPVAMGFALGNAVFRSTDQDFKVTDVQDGCNLIYKILNLEKLLLYCNTSDSAIYGETDSVETMQERFVDFYKQTASGDKQERITENVVEPLNFDSRLILNPQTGSDECKYAVPKVSIDLGLENLGLALTRQQYLVFMEFLETFDEFRAKSKYHNISRPKRPFSRAAAREWWNFAQNAIRTHEVRPRLEQWSWEHMKAHRQKLKEYSALYSEKLSKKSLSSSDQSRLDELEKDLDLFNIVLARHDAQYRVNRDRRRGSWWSWLTGKGKQDEANDESDLRSRIQVALSEEDKAQLEKALSISNEPGTPGDFPLNYVSTRVKWNLRKAQLALRDQDREVTALKLSSFNGKMEFRPHEDGFLVDTGVDDVEIVGVRESGNDQRIIIAERQEGSSSLLQLLYDWKPVDSAASLRCQLSAAPVKVVYHPETVNAVVEFFKPPREVALQQLQAQAILALQTLRESTVAKLKSLLSNQQYIDMNIDFRAPYFVLPEHGVDMNEASSLVIDFGRLRLLSTSKEGAFDVETASVDELKELAYERYQLLVDDMQVLFAVNGEDWDKARHDKQSHIRILHPISCELELQNCVIRNHPMLPLGKVKGTLPSVKTDITRERLLHLLRVLLTVPLPDFSYSGDLEFSEKAREIVREYHDTKLVQTLYVMKQPEVGSPILDQRIVDIDLCINEISVGILNDRRSPIFAVGVRGCTPSLSMVAASTELSVGFDDLSVEFTPPEDGGHPIRLIGTHRANTDDPTAKTLTVAYQTVDSLHPDFESRYENTLANLGIIVRGVEVNLDQRAILDMVTFAENLKNDAVAVFNERTSKNTLFSTIFGTAQPQKQPDEPEQKQAGTPSDIASAMSDVDEGFVAEDKLIHLALNISTSMLAVSLTDPQGTVCRAVVSGLDAGMIQKNSSTSFSGHLDSLSLENPKTPSLYPTIIKTKGEELLSFEFVMHNEPLELQRQRGLFSQELQLKLGDVEFVYLTEFFNTLAEYVGELQSVLDRLAGVMNTAGEKTKQAALDAYEQTLRLRLQLDLKAPMICLPENSRSKQALLFDFGRFILESHLSEDSESPLDHIKISVESIGFDRVEDFSDKDGKRNVIEILREPQPIELFITRNLKYPADASRPEIEMRGKLPALEVELSDKDLEVIQTVIEQNFGQQPSAPTVEVETEATPTEASSQQPTENSSDVVKSIAPVEEPAISERFKVSFEVELLSAKLSWHDGPPGKLSRSRRAGNDIAQLLLESFVLDCTVFSDGALQGLVGLYNISLLDKRYDSEHHICDIVRVKKERENTYLIRCDAKRDRNGDQVIEVDIGQIEAVVIVDFFEEVMSFIYPPNEKQEPEQKKSVPSSPPRSPAKETPTSPVPPLPTTPANALSVSVTTRKPSIVLVEDPWKLDSKVLLLTTDIKLTAGKSQSGISFQASAEALRMDATRFQSRSSNPQPILLPVDLAVQYKASTAAVTAQHIGITSTDILLTIDPSIIKLLSTALGGLTGGKTTDELPEHPVGVYDDLWQQQDFDKQALDELLTSEDAEMSGELSNMDEMRSEDFVMFDFPSILIVIELGEVNRRVPAFLLDLRAFGSVSDWSSAPQAKATLFIEAGYYNPRHDVWEAIIEPVDNGKTENPWDCTIQLSKNRLSVAELRRAVKQGLRLQKRTSSLGSVEFDSASTSTTIPSTQDIMGSEVMVNAAAMSIDVKSSSPLEFTVTKTGLDLIRTAVDAFLDAANKDLPLQEAESAAPFILFNHLGIDVDVQVVAPLTYGSANVTEGTDREGSLKVRSGSQREIHLSTNVHKYHKHILHQGRAGPDLRLKLTVGGRTMELSLLKAERRFFFIHNSADVDHPYRLIIDIVAEASYKAIHLQSPMTITNYLLMPIEVQGGFSAVDHASVVDPNQTIFMPIGSVQFDERAVLACRPAGTELYRPSRSVPIGEILRMDAQEKQYILECQSAKLGTDPTLYFMLYCKATHVKYENSAKVTSNSLQYQVYLRSVITVTNVLPYDIEIGYCDAKQTRLLAEELEVATTFDIRRVPIRSGDSHPMYETHPEKHRLLIKLKDYMMYDWEGDILIDSLKGEFTPCMLVCQGTPPVSNVDDGDSHKQDTLLLGLRTFKEDGTIFITVYSPLWMLNKTGLGLRYKNPIREHRAEITQPLLYATSYGSLQERRKIQMKVENSDWSKKFSPDAVGSNGIVYCADRSSDRKFELGLQIKSSASVLTKIVVFTPYFVLSNVSTKVAFEVREMNEKAEWILIKPKETVPFWPIYRVAGLRDEEDTNKDQEGIAAVANRLLCRVAGTEECSSPFAYDTLQNNLLRLDNRFGGVYIETQVSECNAVTTFQPYYPGRPVYMLINTLPGPVWIREKNSTVFMSIEPSKQRMFAFEFPTDNKCVEYTVDQRTEYEVDFDKDDAGSLPMPDGQLIHWVCFATENKRMLLFTDDLEFALNTHQSVDLEPTSLELNASIERMGLSLVNNVAGHEVMYAGIVSGGPVWKYRRLKKNKRLHLFKGKEAKQLEEAYQKYKSNIEADIHIKSEQPSGMEVDFDQMTMTKPHHCQIQRVFEDGLWCRLKVSPSQYQLHLKLEKVQIDNPNPESQYPTLLSPVPLPESAGHKPLIEVSAIVRQPKSSKVPQFRLVEALVQEVEIRADQGVVNSVLSILQPENEDALIARHKMLMMFHELDGAEVRRSLSDTVTSVVGTEEPYMFDQFVLQPLKLRVSFSMTGGEIESQSAMDVQSQFIALFLKTLGVTATEFNDVLIKLATFERLHKALNKKQMLQQLGSHYSSQLLKQLYTVVLGLDILGNPFGLIRGISGGVRDLFYEPFEGLVEGPEEFVQGIGSGVTSLMGASVGGVLDTAGKISGSVGRAIASVSFDEKFIRNRQRERNSVPTDLPSAIVHSGKVLGEGITQGVTGVVTKPVEGLRQEGIAGFVKGVGKGLIGAVVRPTAGLVDFATSAFEATRRIAKSEVDPVRLRPARHIPPNGVVRPYNLHQAEGAYVFREVRKKSLRDDHYITHLVTSRERKYILMVTTNRVLYLERGDILQGHYAITWEYEWENFVSPPSMTEKGIMFPVSEPEGKGIKAIMHPERRDRVRYVFVEDVNAGEWFIKKVTDVMEAMRGKEPVEPFQTSIAA